MFSARNIAEQLFVPQCYWLEPFLRCVYDAQAVRRSNLVLCCELVDSHEGAPRFATQKKEGASLPFYDCPQFFLTYFSFVWSAEFSCSDCLTSSALFFFPRNNEETKTSTAGTVTVIIVSKKDANNA